jgi:tetratricopeptide (TPR) repeat protein
MIMKLIRWLLSNIILIVFVLAITYAYVYWDNLTGEDTPLGKVIAYLSVEYDEVSEFLDGYEFDDGRGDRVAEPEPEPAAEMAETASVPQVMPPPGARTMQASRQQPVPPQQPVPAQTMPRQPPVQAARPPVPERQPPAMPASRPQIPPTAMMQRPPAMPPVEPPPARPERAQPAAPALTSEADIRKLWISAREEYHRGNIEQSIANYQQLIASSSDNYDAYGELGNVYMSRGKYREAAGAYYQAGAILVKLGQTGRARSLLPMLERLDRARAEELNQLMMAPRS